MLKLKDKWVLWDCDDTLVNSEIIAMGVAIDLLADETEVQSPTLKIDRSHLVREYAGWHFDKMIEAFHNQYGTKFDYSSITNKKTDATLSALSRVEPIDHIEAALTKLSLRYHFALVTSSEFSRVNLCLNTVNLDKFFPTDKRYSGHDSLTPSRHKPLPDIYLHAIKDSQINPDNVVTIEDSPSGVISAVEAGIPVIGFVATRRVISEADRDLLAQKLLSAGAQFVVSDARDLPSAVDSILNSSEFLLEYGKLWKSSPLSMHDGAQPSLV